MQTDNIFNVKDLNVTKFLAMFRQFPPAQRLQIAEKINQQTFSERWQQLDAELPDVEMSEEEIMNEVKAVRYGATTES